MHCDSRQKAFTHVWSVLRQPSSGWVTGFLTQQLQDSIAPRSRMKPLKPRDDATCRPQRIAGRLYCLMVKFLL
ncbi:MAG: hypothetical protein PVH87_28955 [Desulfobacteraceae bacterium]|jgi:hypothetical protein